ncbi:MAG: FAD-binding oxidoreductase [Alphaproteobacteria bacterium]|nr:FAD-binding oxidoreductase [Alphaproteobacteria bacterium]
MGIVHRTKQRLIEAIGEDLNLLPDASISTDSHAGIYGTCMAIAQPKSVETLAKIVRLCHEENLPVVPQGGRTGLVGGAVPLSDRTIAIDMSALNNVRTINRDNLTAIVDAGIVLADLQRQLEPFGLRFPIDIGSAESCQIGGMLATNAGGIAAVRHGSMRDLTLGVEVVLPSGDVWNGLQEVRKDNAGYDLKHCFIGSEGTLGVISGAVLKLTPLPQSRATAMAALSSIEDLLPVFTEVQSAVGDFLSAFELVSGIGYTHTLATDPTITPPFTEVHGNFLVVEVEAYTDIDLDGLLQSALHVQIEKGRLKEVLFATNMAQRANFWRIRELTPWVGASSIQFDISVPSDRIEVFLSGIAPQLQRLADWLVINAFGHVGDGNIHYHVCVLEDGYTVALEQLHSAISNLVYDRAVALGGSISAEHGIGLTRKEELLRYKDSLELSLMRALKVALDPGNIMNPGKIISL